MTAKNEALFRLGKLLGDKDGPMAEEIKKIADLVGGIEESAPERHCIDSFHKHSTEDEYERLDSHMRSSKGRAERRSIHGG